MNLIDELNRSLVTVWSKSEQAFHMWQSWNSTAVHVIDANGNFKYMWNMVNPNSKMDAYGKIIEYICDCVNG